MLIKEITSEFILENKKIFVLYVIINLLTVPVEIYLLPKYISSFFLKTLTNTKNLKITSLQPIMFSLILILFFSLMRIYFENKIIPKFVIHIRKWMFKYIIKKHQKAFETLPMGKIIAVLSELPNSAKNIIVTLIRVFMPYFSGFFFLIIYFFYYSFSLGFLHIVTITLCCLIYYLVGFKKCALVSEEAQNDMLNLTENVQDRLSNLMSVYASQTENKEVKTHEKYENKNEVLYRKSLNCIWRIECIGNIIIIISFVIFNFLIINLYNSKKITTPILTSLYMAEVYYFITFLRRIQNHSGDVINAYGNIISIEKYLNNYNIEEKNNSKKIIKPNDNNVIDFENISYKYSGSKKYVLKNVNLKIKKHEKVWLSGNSGSGKTTIFKLIMGTISPTEGNIYIGEKKMNLKNDDVYKIRNEITYINQDTKLFNSSVYENMIYGSKVKKSDVIKILKNMNITVFDKLSNGINSSVGVGGSSLSGGQRQVVLLLRAFFRKSNIILMDEPISAVDSDSIKEVLKVIEDISKDKTLLIISHNDKILPIVTRTILMKNIDKE